MAKGRTTAGIKTELSAADSYRGEINVYRLDGRFALKPGSFEQGYSASDSPPLSRRLFASPAWGYMPRVRTYKFYVYEEHCEFVRKLQHGVTVTSLDESGFGNRRILALWPPGRSVPVRDEHSRTFWKNQSRGAVDSAECLYPKLGRLKRTRNALIHDDPRPSHAFTHIDQVDEPYLDLKWALDLDSSLSSEETLRRNRPQSSSKPPALEYRSLGSNWENTRCVLLYTFPVSDEPHHVSIEVIRDALLGIR